jgi:carboxylate-amine ligase
MSGDGALRLFEAYGIEIEYMIVDAQSLAVRASADELLRAASGGYESEIEMGDIAWSNELALHLMEMKTNGPVRSLSGLADAFQQSVKRANELLHPLESILLPTAMHPWMDPRRELVLWPHEYNEIYTAYDRIFNCHDHGWANVQSVHLNLPFANESEFARLHAAIRLALPLIPGIAASSPIVEGRLTGRLDNRLYYYARHAARVPSVVGSVIPEPIFSIKEYEQGLLPRIYADVAVLDVEGVLRNEWLNARGCIARFDRMAIEIRLIDSQECPSADIAVATAISTLVRWLVEEAWCDLERQSAWDHRELAGILDAAIEHADRAIISNRKFLECFAYPERGRARLSDLWQHLVELTLAPALLESGTRRALDLILAQGCLARRLREAVQQEPTPERLHAVYSSLAACLAEGRLFEVGS